MQGVIDVDNNDIIYHKHRLHQVAVLHLELTGRFVANAKSFTLCDFCLWQGLTMFQDEINKHLTKNHPEMLKNTYDRSDWYRLATLANDILL